LAFEVESDGAQVIARSPDHRLDIGEGIVGVADLLEELARIYGYDRIPETQISDTIPPQYGNPDLAREGRVRDLLVSLGLQEVVTYRLTSPEREARVLAPGTQPDDHHYVRIANPIVSDRVVMRHSLLASVLEVVEFNSRFRDSIAIFEIAPVYLPAEGDDLPEEPSRLVIVMTGARTQRSWRGAPPAQVDFFDVKGVLQALMDGLHLPPLVWEAGEHPSFHPGKCAHVLLGGARIGVVGELHPGVQAQYSLSDAALIAAELDLDAITAVMTETHPVRAVPSYPPVLEDLAVVVDDDVPAEVVEGVIRTAAGELLRELQLFDLYRGDQVGAGKKSMAYALVYQAFDRTLTDEEVAAVRSKVVASIETELGGKLRD
jgi:phenylalanyl-tRNA synthetase beta chain